MIVNIQQKYDELSPAQKDIFAGYGLRQVKHFVEISLPTIEAALPTHTLVQGINAEGKIQAMHSDTLQTYLWISDQKWQETAHAPMPIDLKEDFIEVWRIFGLSQYELIALSHIHRDFLENHIA